MLAALGLAAVWAFLGPPKCVALIGPFWFVCVCRGMFARPQSTLGSLYVAVSGPDRPEMHGAATDPLCSQ